MNADQNDFPALNAIEARVLGCLIEKKETTPDVYPLTTNAALAAANQKTAREPVMSLETADIHRAFTLLEQKGMVKRVFASRVERYEHTLAQRFSLTQQQISILGLLLLRGPQTAHELLARSERMARMQSIDELRSNLDLLIGRRPPLIIQLDRAPGQREERFAHLLCGEVQMPVFTASAAPSDGMSLGGLEERIEALEAEVAELRQKLDTLIG